MKDEIFILCIPGSMGGFAHSWHVDFIKAIDAKMALQRQHGCPGAFIIQMSAKSVHRFVDEFGVSDD